MFYLFFTGSTAVPDGDGHIIRWRTFGKFAIVNL